MKCVRSWFAAALVPLFLTVVSGCALFGGEEHVFGEASLGDAARAVNGDSTRKVRRDEPAASARPLDVGWTTRTEATAPEVTSFEASPAPGIDADRGSRIDDGATLLGLSFAGGGLGGATYDGFGSVGIGLGHYFSPRWRADLVGSFTTVNFTGSSVAGQAFRNEMELTAELDVRYYLTPPHTLMGVYPIVGARTGTLFWSFDRPVAVVEDVDVKQVRDDYINFLSLYTGVGVSLIQIRHLHIGIHAVGGIKLYDVQTHQGFSNDLFPDAGFVETTVETTYRF